MRTGLIDTLKSRLFAGAVHAALWLLLILSVMGLGGRLPDFHDSDSLSSSPQSPIPVTALQQLASPAAWPKPAFDTNSLSPYFTRHFIPPQVPAPPAPTTRKFEMTYQGFYQSEGGSKQTMIRLGDAYLVTPIGARMLSNLFVADATFQALTLTNSAAQTNVLPLNTKKEIEVPIQ